MASDEDIFKKHTLQHQAALKQSRYSHTLKYEKNNTTTANNYKNNRKRNIIWYNPPYNKDVLTNVGKIFLKLINDCFPKGNILHKGFNKNSIKISYSCTPNIKQLITMHNGKILNTSNNNSNTDQCRNCNCRNRQQCPLSNNCLIKDVIYLTSVTTENNTETYVGSTENNFKMRYNNHTASFRDPNKQTSTELSKYIWQLKDNNKTFNVKWAIIKTAPAYKPALKKCYLCLWEKLLIIKYPDKATLNRRNELASCCRHTKKFSLANYLG